MAKQKSKRQTFVNVLGVNILASKLVRMGTLAELMGKKYREDGKPYSKAYISLLMKQGKIPDQFVVVIDDTTFISTDFLNEMQLAEKS